MHTHSIQMHQISIYVYKYKIHDECFTINNNYNNVKPIPI